MVMWHDVKKGMAADHDDWHSHEHIPERIGIVGFRRGRRCRGAGGWFILYEVDDVDVLTSPPYLERLNQPSPWSTSVIPSITGMNRTLARVEQSHGTGVGGYIVTIRSEIEVPEGLIADLPVRRGIIGAHSLRGDGVASGLRTKEKSLRDRPDGFAPWTTLIEGYDKSALDEICRELVLQLGGDPSVIAGIYQVNHIVAEADI